MYRPVTRLVLANWKDLDERIKHFTPEQWENAYGNCASKLALNQKGCSFAY